MDDIAGEAVLPPRLANPADPEAKSQQQRQHSLLKQQSIEPLAADGSSTIISSFANTTTANNNGANTYTAGGGATSAMAARRATSSSPSCSDNSDYGSSGSGSYPFPLSSSSVPLLAPRSPSPQQQSSKRQQPPPQDPVVWRGSYKRGGGRRRRTPLMVLIWLVTTVFLLIWLYIFDIGGLHQSISPLLDKIKPGAGGGQQELPEAPAPWDSYNNSSAETTPDLPEEGSPQLVSGTITSGGDASASTVPASATTRATVTVPPYGDQHHSTSLPLLTYTTSKSWSGETNKSTAATISGQETGKVVVAPTGSVATATTTLATVTKTSSSIKMAKPSSAYGSSSSPAFTVPQGRYIGLVLEESPRFPKPVEAFRGVPFAQSTGGQNRFRPPQPLEPSDKVFNAFKFGQNCPYGGTLFAGHGENCLVANIYRPVDLVDEGGFRKGTLRREGEKGERPLLPIAVYIHGGGFNGGFGAERNMASFVSWSKEPMIGINFNYRVGALGFLPSSVTAREGLLNLGLRDQQMLLEWVRDNAEALGGDPENITIMGVSAGAHSIGHHIMHYARRNTPAPFAKAIMESGATTARAVLVPSHPRHENQFRDFLKHAKLDGVPDDQIFERLREAPLADLVRASKQVWDHYEPSVTWPFQPVIDGLTLDDNAIINQDNIIKNTSSKTAPIIPDLPIASWRQGKFMQIPVLTGFNTNEGTIFIPARASTNQDFRRFFKTLIPGLGEDDLHELERLYPDPNRDPSSPYKTVPRGHGRQWARLDKAYSHYAYICPVLQSGHYLSAASGNKDVGGKNSNKVYVYRFAATGPRGCANHGDEAPVVAHDMGFLDRDRMPGLVEVADAMHSAWASFVVNKVGDPNGFVLSTTTAGGKVVEWPEFRTPFEEAMSDVGNGSSIQIKTGVGVGSEDDDTGRIMVFGEGNDERRGREGKMSRGTTARVQRMSDLELEACRFWWDRIELSEGFGVRKGVENVERVGDGDNVKAKL